MLQKEMEPLVRSTGYSCLFRVAKHFDLRNLTCPLYVNKILFSNLQCVGGKVILHCWIHLHYVPTLASHIQVEDAETLKLTRTRAKQEHMAPVLEDTAVLRCVNGQSQRGGSYTDVNVGVLLHWGFGHSVNKENIELTFAFSSVHICFKNLCIKVSNHPGENENLFLFF